MSDTPLYWAEDSQLPDNLQEWFKYIKSADYKPNLKYMTNVIIFPMNAKIRQMSKRRQKIALAKRPAIRLTGVFPKSVADKFGEAVTGIPKEIGNNTTFIYDSFEKVT